MRSLGHGLPTLSLSDRARLLRESRSLPISGVSLSNEDDDNGAKNMMTIRQDKRRSVMAHRFMLCARSPYFRAVLESSNTDMEDEYVVFEREA